MTRPDAAPVCSVVIPTYNGRGLLEVCLASIERNRPADIPIEVIVADDASTDGTADWIARAFPRVKVVRLETNLGFCGAANAGVAAARGTFVQLLNNDTEVLPGWIEAGLRPFEDPAVGSTAPLVLVRSDPGRLDSAGDGYTLMGWPFKRGHGESADAWTDRAPDHVLGASGSSAFYRASALKTVGVYDALYGSYYEDVDLAFRLRWAGYRCVFVPDCRILHEVSASYDHARPGLQRRLARNSELLFWSNLPGSLLAAALIPRLAFLAAQLATKLARWKAGPFLDGKKDALGLIREIRERRRVRRAIRSKAVARPSFPLTVNPLRVVANHRRRPTEASARLKDAARPSPEPA